MTQSTEQERELFEAVASDDGKWPQAIERDAKGNYLLLTTANGWMWWQAARRAPVVPHTKVKPDFYWDSEKQHHVPTLLIEFEPVPAGEPCYAKGWTDRDNLAAMLAAAPQPPEAAQLDDTNAAYMHQVFDLKGE